MGRAGVERGRFEALLPTRVLSLALLALGCATSREMPTMQEMVARTKPAPRCDHFLEIVPESSVTRPYEEVSRISVTCHPALPEMCDRSLRERGCALNADLILLQPAAPGTARDVPESRDQIWKSAILARFR